MKKIALIFLLISACSLQNNSNQPMLQQRLQNEITNYFDYSSINPKIFDQYFIEHNISNNILQHYSQTMYYLSTNMDMLIKIDVQTISHKSNHYETSSYNTYHLEQIPFTNIIMKNMLTSNTIVSINTDNYSLYQVHKQTWRQYDWKSNIILNEGSMAEESKNNSIYFLFNKQKESLAKFSLSKKDLITLINNPNPEIYPKNTYGVLSDTPIIMDKIN